MKSQSCFIKLLHIFLFQNNLKNLDPSCRLDLDFGIIWKEKPDLISEE